jgi:hypothetical protein
MQEIQALCHAGKVYLKIRKLEYIFFLTARWWHGDKGKEDAMSAELQMIKKMEKLDRDAQQHQPGLTNIPADDIDKTGQ